MQRKRMFKHMPAVLANHRKRWLFRQVTRYFNEDEDVQIGGNFLFLFFFFWGGGFFWIAPLIQTKLIEAMPMNVVLQVCVCFPYKEVIDRRAHWWQEKSHSTTHTTAHADGASVMPFFRYCLNCKPLTRANDLFNQNIVYQKPPKKIMSRCRGE